MQDVSPDPFVEAVLAYQKSAAVIAALELGLFTAICEGATTYAALAARIGAAERGARILADYLAIQGFLTKSDGHYGLTPSTAMFLDKRSPTYMGSIADFLASGELRAHPQISESHCSPVSGSGIPSARWAWLHPIDDRCDRHSPTLSGSFPAFG